MSPVFASCRALIQRLSCGLALALTLSAPAWAGDLAFGYTTAPGPGEKPALLVTPQRALAEITVVVEAGGQTYEFTERNVTADRQLRFEWKRDTSVTTATAWVTAEFSDMATSAVSIPLEYSYGGGLKIDLSSAAADVSTRKLMVSVTESVDRADIQAYGARKALLGTTSVGIGAGPGEIEIPWVGEPEDVVLLDVTLHNAHGWAGFTYSPWFLDVPHNDVLFESGDAVVLPAEEPKLEDTLNQLTDVVEQYGSVVPVKLYIAGCTDTVGPASSNKELSRRRAKAIAIWLRNHGYRNPIYYYGFGEELLAIGTPDDTEEQANRRALYMVGANPPPRGSGVPGVSWIPL